MHELKKIEKTKDSDKLEIVIQVDSAEEKEKLESQLERLRRE